MYNSSGTAQWVSSATNASSFSSVAVDSSANIYAAGSFNGTEVCGFGNGISVTGLAQDVFGNGENLVLVKYNSSGVAQWAQAVLWTTDYSYQGTVMNDSSFSGVAVDSSGNVYAAGRINYTQTYSFGNGITAIGAGPSYNSVLVKYNSSGTAQWTQTLISSSDFNGINSIAVDSTGNLYTAASTGSTAGTYNFGNSITATGSGSGNALLVKYQ